MKTFLPIASLVAGLGLLAGCNILPEAVPDNTRHYILQNPPMASVGSGEATVPHVRLGLRSVEVPAYLREKAMAVRTGENELRFAADARWAEPLEAGITRVLREQLSAGAHVVGYPFPGQLERQFDVTVRVLSAEGTSDGVRFVAVYELLRVGDRPEVAVRREFRWSGRTRTWDGDYGRLAADMSDAVAELAREIVAALPQEQSRAGN